MNKFDFVWQSLMAPMRSKTIPSWKRLIFRILLYLNSSVLLSNAFTLENLIFSSLPNNSLMLKMPWVQVLELWFGVMVDERNFAFLFTSFSKLTHPFLPLVCLILKLASNFERMAFESKISSYNLEIVFFDDKIFKEVLIGYNGNWFCTKK